MSNGTNPAALAKLRLRTAATGHRRGAKHRIMGKSTFSKHLQ
jgi:hypothetical protein